MSENHDKEVFFNLYCNKCTFESYSEEKFPCSECMEYPVNTDSHKPVNFQEKK